MLAVKRLTARDCKVIRVSTHTTYYTLARLIIKIIPHKRRRIYNAVPARVTLHALQNLKYRLTR